MKGSKLLNTAMYVRAICVYSHILKEVEPEEKCPE